MRSRKALRNYPVRILTRYLMGNLWRHRKKHLRRYMRRHLTRPRMGRLLKRDRQKMVKRMNLCRKMCKNPYSRRPPFQSSRRSLSSRTR